MTFPRRSLVLAAACLASLTASAVSAQEPPDLTYHTVAPCVVLDTRVAVGVFAANETRTYTVTGSGSLASQGGSSSGCGVPGFSNNIPQVQAVALNIVAINANAAGHLQAWAADTTTTTSVLNFTTGVNIANTAPVAVAQTSGVGDFKIKMNIASGHVQVIAVGYYSKDVQTVHVHPVPGDHTASGTRLLNELAAISNASATKRYVIELEPGIYDVGSTVLQMKQYVDLVGSGQDATVIKGYGSNDLNLTTGVIEGESFAELRNLQVHCDGDGYTYPYGIAIYNDGVSPRIKDVKIVATENTRSWGIRSENAASPTIEDVQIESEGSLRAYGIVNTDSGTDPMIQRVVIDASGGTGENHGIANFISSRPVVIRDVQITVAGGSGSSVDGIYVPSSTTNPTRITNATISVSGGSSIQGIHSDGATVEVEQSQVRASGSGSYGIYSTGTVRVDHSLIAGVGSTVTASTATIGATRLEGGAVSAASATCAGVYDESYVFSASTCP